jgi:hypothetical protein
MMNIAVAITAYHERYSTNADIRFFFPANRVGEVRSDLPDLALAPIVLYLFESRGTLRLSFEPNRLLPWDSFKVEAKRLSLLIDLRIALYVVQSVIAQATTWTVLIRLGQLRRAEDTDVVSDLCARYH